MVALVFNLRNLFGIVFYKSTRNMTLEPAATVFWV